MLPVLLVLSALAMPGCDQGGAEPSEVAGDTAQAPDTQAPAPEPEAEANSDAAAPEETAWTVPAGWTYDPEPRPMRLATYIAPDPEGDIEVAVTRFAGRVGGVLPNINRWRTQMGLAPVDEAGLEDTIERFEAPGFDAYKTRLESESGVMLAAAVYQEDIDQTWFLRATVSSAEVAGRVEQDFFAMARSIARLED